MKIVGAYIGCNLDPEGIIAMDFPNLAVAKAYVAKRHPPIHHWCLHGMCDDELVMLYEEKDGKVLKNLWTTRKLVNALEAVVASAPVS